MVDNYFYIYLVCIVLVNFSKQRGRDSHRTPFVGCASRMSRYQLIHCYYKTILLFVCRAAFFMQFF